MQLIRITFNRNKEGKPILHLFPDGSWGDECGRKVTKEGYLIDIKNNIVDQDFSILI